MEYRTQDILLLFRFPKLQLSIVPLPLILNILPGIINSDNDLPKNGIQLV